jgi:hypothetical protein
VLFCVGSHGYWYSPASPVCLSYQIFCHTGGRQTVPNVAAILQRFTTEWAAVLQPEAVLVRRGGLHDLARPRTHASYHCGVSANCLHGFGRFNLQNNLIVRTSGVAAQRITSVAWKRVDWGSVRPSAVAVFRLMTKSKRIGRSTGSSLGCAPLRSLSTNRGARRYMSAKLPP